MINDTQREQGLDPKAPPTRAINLYARGVNECARLGLPSQFLRVEWLNKISCWRFDGVSWRGAYRIGPFDLCRWLDVSPRKNCSIWTAIAGPVPGKEFLCGLAPRAWLEFANKQEALWFSLPSARVTVWPRRTVMRTSSSA